MAKTVIQQEFEERQRHNLACAREQVADYLVKTTMIEAMVGRAMGEKITEEDVATEIQSRVEKEYQKRSWPIG